MIFELNWYQKFATFHLKSNVKLSDNFFYVPFDQCEIIKHDSDLNKGVKCARKNGGKNERVEIGMIGTAWSGQNW